MYTSWHIWHSISTIVTVVRVVAVEIFELCLDFFWDGDRIKRYVTDPPPAPPTNLLKVFKILYCLLGLQILNNSNYSHALLS